MRPGPSRGQGEGGDVEVAEIAELKGEGWGTLIGVLWEFEAQMLPYVSRASPARVGVVRCEGFADRGFGEGSRSFFLLGWFACD